MWKGETVTFDGKAWEGEVDFTSGMRTFAVPLQPDVQWQLRDLANYIGEELLHLITFNRSAGAFETYTPDIDPPSSIRVDAGVGYLTVMSEPKTVVFNGAAWENNGGTAFAAPKGYASRTLSSAPVLVVQGKALNPAGGMDVLSASGISIQVTNQNTGVEKTVTANSNGDYVATFIDFLDNETVSVGDAIQIKVMDSQWTTQAMPYELTTEDIRVNHIALPEIQLEAMPRKSMLLQSYPNPANPETWVPYCLSEGGDVHIEIYNISGQVVRTLELGIKEAGNHVSRERAAYWDGNNNVGEAVASGIYFYVIRSGAFGGTGRMVILK